MGVLSLFIFLPLLAIIIILLTPKQVANSMKFVALLTTILQFLLAGYLLGNYDTDTTGAFNQIDGYQFVEQLPWIRLDLGSIGQLEIDYFIGVDGFSLPLLALSAFVMLMAIGASWNMTK